MIVIQRVRACLMAMVVLFAMQARAKVVAHHTPALGPVSSEFSLTVSGTAVPVYAFQRELETPDYYFAHFSFNGKAKIEVRSADGKPFEKVRISPLAFAIPSTVKNNVIRFEIKDSRYLIVTVDGRKPLIVAADPMEADVPHERGKGIFNITEFGADSSGEKDATEAIGKAIAAAAALPAGGTVYVPAGTFTAGNIVLKSNVTLYLHGDAVLRASHDASRFNRTYVVGSPGYYGKKPESGTWFVSTEPGSSNVTIRGRGVIDGSGSYLTTHEWLLDDIIVPLGTTHFTLDGIVGWDAGFWALTANRSRDVKILNYKGMQSMTTYQDDGIDIDESQHAVVRHAIVASRDDCYSTKSWGPNGLGKNWPGQPQVVDDVLFQDAVAWTTDGAFKIGQGDFQPHSHIKVDHGYVYGAHWAIYLKPNLPANENAAPVSDAQFSNIDVETDPASRQGGPFTWLYIESPYAKMSNIEFRNINVRVVGQPPSITTKGPGRIEGLRFENITIEGKKLKSIEDLGTDLREANVSGVAFK